MKSKKKQTSNVSVNGRKKVLVVAAHPDDEILGLGATLAKHVQSGDEVHIVIIGDGVTARYDKHELNKPEVKKQTAAIKEHAIQSAKSLGVRDIQFYGHLCCRFDSIGTLEISKIIERHITALKPEILYTHHHSDVNNDHRMVFDAAMSAIRPVNGFPVKEILCFESPSSTDWIPPVAGRVFTPNVFVDVKDTFHKKIEALKCYQGEIRDYPHPRSPEALETMAKKWGTVSGMHMAEAFQLIRKVR